MKKKILNIFLVCFAFVFLFSFAVLPTFAYTSLNGWSDFSPNMPDMQMFYKVPGSTSATYPRTLTGYVAYHGSGIASQSGTGVSMRTFKTSESLGYQFSAVYAAEIFIDFVYLPFSSNPNTVLNTYSVELELNFTTNSNDYSDNTVHLRVGYYNSSDTISSKNFSYDFSNDSTRVVNLYDILNDTTVHGLAFVQIGYDYSSKTYASSKTVNGFITISDLNTWISNDPFVNSSQTLYDVAYQRGYSKAVDEIGGESAVDTYAQGYNNGYNAGRLDGYNEGFNQATNDNSNVNYQNGYQAGYSAGYNFFASTIENQLSAKYQEGYGAGYDVGFSEGEEEGYNLGYGSGYDVGYESGVTDDANRFYDEGFSAGEEAGYQAGYDVGISESIEEMGLFNYIVSSCNAIFQIPLGNTFTLGGLLAVIISVPLLLALIKLLGA